MTNSDVTVASLTLTATDQAASVKLGDGTTSGDTLKIGNTTYEFVATGKTAQTGNTAIELGSTATVADAMKAIAAKAGSGVAYDSTKGVLTTGTNDITAAFTNVTNPTTVAYNANSKVSVAGFTATAGTAADQIAVGLKGGVTTAVSALQSAITSMSSVMQGLGNYSNTLTGMTTYTKSLTDAVTNGVSALTDADMAAASAKLTSLQTKQSLAIKSLTIANGQSQNILSLFQG
jgi:flagellin